MEGVQTTNSKHMEYHDFILFSYHQTEVDRSEGDPALQLKRFCDSSHNETNFSVVLFIGQSFFRTVHRTKLFPLYTSH
jgi:glucan biosynthesis protein